MSLKKKPRKKNKKNKILAKNNSSVLKKRGFQAVRGMHDLLAKDWLYYEWIYNNAKKILEFGGFSRIETPILERADLFMEGVGKNTDLAGKEMYFLKTKEEKELLALRPEGTASLARAYLENGMVNLPQPIKLYYFGPFFRHEKPQAGRYRQFYQLGAEIIGEGDFSSDVSIILIAKQILEALGFSWKNIRLSLNSIGCQKCRPNYLRALKKHYRFYKKKICSNCSLRLKNNPLRVLDCKDEKCLEVKNSVPPFLDYLCDDCRSHFKGVLELLDYLEIPYFLDKTLVRGFDYYTKTVFEFYLENEEKNLALAGGGRYDRLVELLGGPRRPAIGMAFGVDRLVEELKKKGKILKLPQPKVFLVQIGEMAKKQSFKLLEKFREENIAIGESLGKESLGSQLNTANKLGIKYTLIFGQQEVLDGMVILKDMDSGIQETIPLDKIVEEVKKRLKQNQ
ncbi:MAG: histidine--tRNA ligase [Candidatus Pacebacteria bacterium]|nr:histidine--tRNA ligase [Candidatus Paceibacterota bacterium]